ncbi:hypothetical protein [Actinophytocola xanthii]|uniref:Uncharacterized protein n=1 Tax=Actinophytocola xanthii TaxID=1912961 RepID=A0A1Q8CN85_9PSEU|nr:hypothetical protein [Actinophytocola xanthii]OLF15821.1 hypothetical protein BU204_19675 [Actinophytocola xanthii]
MPRPAPAAADVPRLDAVPPVPPPPSERPGPTELRRSSSRIRPVESIRSVFEQEREVEDAEERPAQPPSALSVENPTNTAPSPRRRPGRPRLVPATPPPPADQPEDTGRESRDSHAQRFVDEMLNTQERNLLRELQDELARREKQEKAGPWRSGRHGKPGTPFDQSGPMAVNGVPPRRDSAGSA